MEYIRQTKHWLKGFVIDLNLCPFASVPFRKDQIRYVLEESESEDQLIRTFLSESAHLLQKDAEEVETTLIIHPNVLVDFADYIDFLALFDDLLEEAGLTGILQVASFHPDYRFAGAPPDDPANYTNRSPFPMLHLLREASVSRAVDQFSQPERIPLINMERLRKMSIEQIKNCWQ